MIFNEFLSDIKNSMKQYDSAGLIDEMSVYQWVIDALNAFSMLPTIKIETIVDIKNNTGKLPDGFKTLYSAIKCEPYSYTVEDESQPEQVLQDFYFYKVRELKNEDWNFCNPCDIQETESCVVEKVYLNNGIRANFYYNKPEPLKLNLTSYTKKTKCDRDCLNLNVTDSKHEISINNKTLYTNFREGKVFMVYNGYEEDEDGMLIIPETTENNIIRYLTAYVKKKILEEIFNNSDNTTNEQFLYSMYMQEEQTYFTKTMGELKMKRVLQGMNKYKSQIKKQFQVYNFGEFSYNNFGNRVGFITL